MKSEEEVRRRLENIEDVIKLGRVLNLKTLTPIQNLEAFAEILKWVLNEETAMEE